MGYGLGEKTVNGKKKYEFKVNGVKAKGSFDTADLMALELAKVEGEVNTFKGEERYAFSLEPVSYKHLDVYKRQGICCII